MDPELERLLAEAKMDGEVLKGIRSVLLDGMKRFEGGANKLTGANIAPGGEKRGGGLGVGELFGQIRAGASKGAAALMKIAGLPSMMVAAVTKFVSAINPSLVEALNRVFENLNATIGYAFEPAIAQAVDVVQAFAGQLLPLMEQLRPVVADFAAAVGTLVLGYLRAFTPYYKILLSILAPLVKVFAGFAEVVGTLADVFGAVFEVFVATVTEMLGLGDVSKILADVFEFLHDVAKQAAHAIGFMAGALMKLVGDMKSLAAFRANLEKRVAERKNPAGGLVAAPKDVSTGGIEDIARKASERAFAAMGGAKGKRDEGELLEEILKGLQDVESLDLEALITRAVKEGVSQGLAAGKDVVKKTVRDVSSVLPGPLRRGAERIGQELDDIFGGD